MRDHRDDQIDRLDTESRKLYTAGDYRAAYNALHEAFDIAMELLAEGEMR